MNMIKYVWDVWGLPEKVMFGFMIVLIVGEPFLHPSDAENLGWLMMGSLCGIILEQKRGKK